MGIGWVRFRFSSPAVILGFLGVLAARDVVIALRSRTSRISNRTIGVGIIVAAAVGYLIVVPSVAGFLDQFSETPTHFVIEELTALEVLRIRSAKLLVFVLFAYFGACVGSFLNVVAASVPRGGINRFAVLSMPEMRDSHSTHR